jgi:hypothetical protein
MGHLFSGPARFRKSGLREFLPSGFKAKFVPEILRYNMLIILNNYFKAPSGLHSPRPSRATFTSSPAQISLKLRSRIN